MYENNKYDQYNDNGQYNADGQYNDDGQYNKGKLILDKLGYNNLSKRHKEKQNKDLELEPESFNGSEDDANEEMTLMKKKKRRNVLEPQDPDYDRNLKKLNIHAPTLKVDGITYKCYGFRKKFIINGELRRIYINYRFLDEDDNEQNRKKIRDFILYRQKEQGPELENLTKAITFYIKFNDGNLHLIDKNTFNQHNR